MTERILSVGVKTSEAEAGLDKLRTKFKATGDSAGVMTDQIKKTEGSFSKLKEGAGQLMGVLGGIGAALSFSHALQQSLLFDDAMDRLRNIAGASTKELALFDKQLRSLSETIGTPQKDLAEALLTVKQAGFDGAEAMEVLEAAGKASAAGLGQVRPIVEAVTTAISVYGKTNLSASEAVGTLILASREGKVQLETFESSLGKVLPLAESLGIGFGEVTSATTSMSKAGIAATQAAAALSSIMDTLASPTTTAQKLLEKYNVSVEDLRSSIREKGLLDVLLKLKDAFGDNEDALTQLFPGIRGLNGLLALVGTNAEESRKTLLEFSKSGEVLEKSFEGAKDESLKYQNAIVKLNNTLIQLGAENLPVITTLLEGVGEVLERIRNATVRVAEAFAALSTSSPDVLENAISKAEQLERRLEAQLKLRDAIAASGRVPANADEGARAVGATSFADLEGTIETTRQKLSAFRATIAEENKRDFDQLVQDLGDQSVEDYKKSLVKIVANNDMFFHLGGLVAGYTKEQVDKARIQIRLLNSEAEFLTSKRNGSGVINRGGGAEPKSATDTVVAAITPPVKPKPKIVPLDDSDITKVQSLVAKYDEFGAKLQELSTGFELVNRGVSSGVVTADKARTAYNGLVSDIAASAGEARTFGTAIEQAHTTVELLTTAQQKHGMETEIVSANYRELLSDLANTALTSGDFVSALNNVNAVIGETSEALKSTAVSSQFAKANNAEMVAGLAELALKSGSWEEAVKSANVVLRVMTDMVKANNLDLSAAREIYKSLGEALKDLNPNLERVAQNQADWDLLVSNSITPLEAYETQITSLAAAAERLIAANPQDADNILKHLHEGAVQAAGDYDAALKQLTPEQEKFKASMDRVADAGANAFSQMIQGADDLGDVLTGLLRSIQDVITQMLVLEPIKASLGGFLQNVASNFSWGSIGGSSSAPASGGSAGFVGPPVPGRASGGYMEARKRYIVGEEGVELFLPKDSNLFPRLYGLKGPEQIVSPDVGGLMLSNLKTRELLEDNPEMRGQLERIHPQEEPEHRASGGIIGEGVAMLPQQRVEPLEHPLTVKVVMDRAEKAASVESKEPRTVVNVTNNSNEKAEVRRSSNGNGIDVVDVIIGTVTENIDDRGSIAKSVSRSNRLIRR